MTAILTRTLTFALETPAPDVGMRGTFPKGMGFLVSGLHLDRRRRDPRFQ